ncbi:MAG: family N-acetyltransferase [Pedosphaera sp.]|nr:family N-acetyltransferase [Pedosphaera sp.]
MNEIQTNVEEHCSTEELERIVRALVRYNDGQAAPEAYRDLVVLSRLGGELVGGLIGYTHWDWLFVKQLWVAEAVRRTGVGSSLMRAAEDEARVRGCLHAHCDTFDFQALPFYQRLGYSVFGRLDDYPAGHTRYFLHKRNLHETGNA